MGEIRTKVYLENHDDRARAGRGNFKEQIVRHLEVDAVVDTGAVMTLLPREAIEQLGLEIGESVIVVLANDQKVELPTAQTLNLRIGDRQMVTDCLVGPYQSEPLIGQLVLERLDLVLDPLQKGIHPRPESPFLPSLKMK